MTCHISKTVISITSFFLFSILVFQNKTFAKSENTFHKKLTSVFQKIKAKPLIQANLTYHLYSSFTEKVTTTSGKLLLKKPYFFRWDIIEPEKELQIYNGKTLWKYMPSSKHAQCIPLYPNKIHFLEFFSDLKLLEKEFTVTQSSPKIFFSLSREKYSHSHALKESKNHDKLFLQLVPKKSQNNSDLYYLLLLDGQMGEINEIFISKKNGNKLLFVFSQIKSMSHVKDKDSFVFKAQKGMIIDKCK